MLEYSYWEGTGKYMDFYDELWKQIPVSGSVKQPRKNPKLETFRKATNCYYDLFNNGLCNRAAEFRKVFKIRSSEFQYRTSKYQRDIDFKLIAPVVEKVMDEIIIDAAKEQLDADTFCELWLKTLQK